MTDTDQTEGETAARTFAKALFGPTDETEQTGEPDETDDEPVKPTGNYVPNEGNVPAAKDNSDLALIRALFDN